MQRSGITIASEAVLSFLRGLSPFLLINLTLLVREENSVAIWVRWASSTRELMQASHLQMRGRKKSFRGFFSSAGLSGTSCTSQCLLNMPELTTITSFMTTYLYLNEGREGSGKQSGWTRFSLFL